MAVVGHGEVARDIAAGERQVRLVAAVNDGQRRGGLVRRLGDLDLGCAIQGEAADVDLFTFGEAANHPTEVRHIVQRRIAAEPGKVHRLT